MLQLSQMIKYCGVRLEIKPTQLRITLVNPDKEQTEEEIDLIYTGE